MTAADALSVHLAEYERLKHEQTARIGVRDTLLVTTFGTAGGVAFGAATVGPAVLLLAPLAAILLGWTYITNDRMIRNLGVYFRDVAGLRLETLVGEPVLGWEDDSRGAGRTLRKRAQLGVDLLAFVGLPLAALVVYWTIGPYAPGLLAASAAEVVLLAALAAAAVAYTDVEIGRPR